MTQEFKSEFMKRVSERGFMHQCTNPEALDATLYDHESRGEPFVAYIGFDCTAPSLHVGSLMQIMLLRHFQQCGHKPIVLLGGGTTKIGDPSGKDASRQILDNDIIDYNKAQLAKVFELFLSFGNGATDALIVDNADWLDKLNYIEFLRNYGRHFSVNKMLTMESVKQRLDRESHLSFLEFNYMLLQAYDFVELNKRNNVRLQIGGSDQWGNIVMGSDLHRKCNPSLDSMPANNAIANSPMSKEIIKSYFYRQELQYYIFGLTTPLLTTAAGAKMGKTADGAVWLNPDMLSAYDYWQFWRNCDDADVGRFLRYFTELPLDEIAELEAAEGAAINDAKKILATNATALLHGPEAAQLAEETARQAFELGQTSEHLPGVTLSIAEHGTIMPAFKLFQLAGLAESGGEARRLIKGGGAKLNDVKITDEIQDIVLNPQSLPLKCSAGKKKHILVHVID